MTEKEQDTEERAAAAQRRRNLCRRMQDVVWILAGTTCMALAVNLIYEPLGMVTGGISGLSIVIQKAAYRWRGWEIPVWLSNFLLNIPLFLCAVRLVGKRRTGMSLLANLSFTAALFLIPVPAVPQEDYTLAAITGGVLTGTGLGLVFRRGYSTGGTDLLGTIIHHICPYYPAGQVLFLLDSLIILLGAWLSGVRVAVYAAAAVYLTSRLMDVIAEGSKFARLAYIISDRHEQIGTVLMQRLERGVTVLEGTGMYTGRPRKLLLCVVGRKQIHEVSRIARQIDPGAFVIISDIREVQGEGFVKNPQSEGL